MELSSEYTDQSITTADQVEVLLIEEVRKSDNQTLCCWRENTEEKIAQKTKLEYPEVKHREKKLKWWTTFVEVLVMGRIWRSDTKSYLRVLSESI